MFRKIVNSLMAHGLTEQHAQDFVKSIIFSYLSLPQDMKDALQEEYDNNKLHRNYILKEEN